MNAPSPQTDHRKSFRTQQLVLLGVAALSFTIAWVDGLSGFIHIVQQIQTGQELVRVRMRWYITFGLPLFTLLALILMCIAHVKQRLFDAKTFIISGAVAVSVLIAIMVLALLGFDSWIEKQEYERCTSLDHVQGITRHGSRNVEFSAWTPIGKCASAD